MPNATVICYLSSVLSYGMGFSKMLVLNDAAIAHAYDFNIHVSLATGYFVLAIFFAVCGFLIYTLRVLESNELSKLSDIELRRKARGLDDRGSSLLEVHSN